MNTKKYEILKTDEPNFNGHTYPTDEFIRYDGNQAFVYKSADTLYDIQQIVGHGHFRLDRENHTLYFEVDQFDNIYFGMVEDPKSPISLAFACLCVMSDDGVVWSIDRPAIFLTNQPPTPNYGAQ